MRSFLALLLGLCSLCATAEAQIVAVHFQEAKDASKYKKYLVEHNGEQVLVGEPSRGIVYLAEKHTIQYSPDGINELFVVDPDHPEIPAYRVEGSRRVETSSKNLLTVPGKKIKGVSMLMQDETLPGLSREYLIRREQIDRFRAERDAVDESTRQWQACHVRLVSAMERLAGWLRSTAFPGAIRKLEKEIERENKQVRGEAIRARGEKALASVHEIETPESLVEIAKEVAGGEFAFHAAESQHLRILYVTKIPDERAKAALALGEEIIEGFRAEFVDPYLDDEYQDYIPDGFIHEWFFVPEDVRWYEEFSHRYYGVSWVQNREARLAMSGGGLIGGVPSGFRHFWKTKDDQDLEGIVCHNLGHALAALHYGKGHKNLGQDWLEEALGYYLSFEFLGRNTVTCKAFNVEGTGYVKRQKEKVEGEKTVGEGRRDIYNEVALAEGRPIDQIALKTLYELDDPDLAKSWSFFDFVARKEGKKGQEWLRAAGEFARNRSTFIAKWREAAARILGVTERDAFKALEDRWREYAEHGQDKSEGTGRRRS